LNFGVAIRDPRSRSKRQLRREVKSVFLNLHIGLLARDSGFGLGDHTRAKVELFTSRYLLLLLSVAIHVKR